MGVITNCSKQKIKLFEIVASVTFTLDVGPHIRGAVELADDIAFRLWW